MPVALPERTVDAWVAAYLAVQFPSVVLWAPTQLHHPDYDLAASVPGPGKVFVLENKAPYTNGIHGFSLPVRQMYNYLRHPSLWQRSFYVLPCPPFPVDAVPPAVGPGPPGAPTLLDERAETRLAGHSWAPPGGAEEWFFVISVLDLWTRAFPTVSPPSPGDPWWAEGASAPSGIPASPKEFSLKCPLQALGGLERTLKDFVEGIRGCDLAELRVEPDDSEDDHVAVESDGSGGTTSDTALAVFTPSSDLPGWS